MTRWRDADAAEWLTPPAATDDKYSRGVLGLATGSEAYPGAAVLGAEAALRTGVGMLRYVGPESAGRLVLARRPETVLGPGRTQAWVVGSGMDAAALAGDRGGADRASAARADAVPPPGVDRIAEALASGVPVVLDAGAIDRAPESIGPVVVTPHAGELAALLEVPRDAVLADPVGHARQGAAVLGAVVLLKGSTTFVVDHGREVEVEEATPWLATAGAGDALAGILGALVAARAARGALGHGDLLALGATAAFVHGRAARLAAGSPAAAFTILDLCAAIPDVVRGLRP